MKKVLLLLANGFEAVEASVFTDVIGWNKLEGDGTTELITVGIREELKCTFNFTVTPEMHVSEVNIDEFDALAIPGGFEEAGFYEDAYGEDFLNIIREFDKAGKTIASICVGALPIGKSGVLVNRNATTYNLGNGKRQKQLSEFGANVLADKPIVIDKNIITSYNPSTAFDVAFKLLEILTSKENCVNIKKLMGF
ncbi:DJ-1/PfpI family protein [Clostridium botulinum]|uniref:DJ-1/PfpI family protein n=2 Tax=Clostridium botulinum TaxID=1491 RepID=A0A846I2B4_CLOBO|nr:DJ-1/PfpI family protein [Clostridium botulinum]AJD26935.1 DJ-1/PfpI family protein [Clostridium botulinum CDC_297]ACQ51962.1 DJ-1/PfpI family protein [Clostridium botulinum Ba4 str. 657]AJE11833.1 DJ-1/PfpI family protein [Clostridium botulinum CDC_1436]APR02126.1 DJ-1/PfpI family protein [Clostridium botulinum]APU59911.1 DJ-1/PfpI family protein [Clostridium botulinum]